MNQPENPFFHGGPVDNQKFVGRKEEVDLIFDQLRSHAVGSVAIIGERRIGKTSLLHYVSAPDVIRKWDLNQEKAIFLYQDCGVITPFTITRFWQVVLQKLHHQLIRKRPTDALAEKVATLLAKAEISTSEVEHLLDDVNDAGRLFVLMLDEFEWCVRTDVDAANITTELLAGLRALINHVPRVFSLIVATRRPLDEVCAEIRFMGSPFYNSFFFLHLRPFSPAEAEDLFEQMLADTSVQFSERDKEIIYGLAGTHPLLLQVAAALVFKLKISGAAQVQDFIHIRMQFHDHVRHQFEDFWKWSPRRSRQVLVYLASDRQAEAMELLERWGNERENLVKRGLIVQYRDTFRLFSPTFKEWLVTNFYRLGVSAWLAPQEYQTDRVEATATAEPPTLFISYSHEDEAEKEALLVHLGVLQYGTGRIEVWCDDRIDAGGDWRREIAAAMEKATAAILLVSANFLSSPFIQNDEVPRLLQRREVEGLPVIPVIAKPCAWRQLDWLAGMQARPKNGDPVWRENGIYADAELAAIAEEVAEVIRGD